MMLKMFFFGYHQHHDRKKMINIFLLIGIVLAVFNIVFRTNKLIGTMRILTTNKTNKATANYHQHDTIMDDSFRLSFNRNHQINDVTTISTTATNKSLRDFKHTNNINPETDNENDNTNDEQDTIFTANNIIEANANPHQLDTRMDESHMLPLHRSEINDITKLSAPTSKKQSNNIYLVKNTTMKDTANNNSKGKEIRNDSSSISSSSISFPSWIDKSRDRPNYNKTCSFEYDAVPAGLGITYDVSIFYHVGMIKNWRSIVLDQLHTLEICGLGYKLN